MASMTHHLSKRRTGAAPAADEVRAFVRSHWLKDHPHKTTAAKAADHEEQLRSIERMTSLVARTFSNVYRDNRPRGTDHAESTFWHNWRVAEAVRQSTKHDLLKTFAAFAHDLVEDTRKLSGHRQVTINDITQIWTRANPHKQKQDRVLIAEVLHLKTDAGGLKGAERRMAQLHHVDAVRNGQHGSAGKMFVEILFADKHDNLMSDLLDVKAGYLRFGSAKQVMDLIHKKKSHDLAIVNHMPIAPKQIDIFFDAYKELATELLSHDALIVSRGYAPKRAAVTHRAIHKPSRFLGAPGKPPRSPVHHP